MGKPTELEEEVLEIAEYLGCNGGELWSEIGKLFNKELLAVLERLEGQRNTYTQVKDHFSDPSEFVLAIPLSAIKQEKEKIK
jgi:hypothetical protein